MKYYKIYTIVLLFMISFFGCKKKQNFDIKNNDLNEENGSILKNETEKNNNQSNVINDKEAESFVDNEIEKQMRNFMPALKILNEYSFESIENYDLSLISLDIINNSEIACSYDGKVFCKISDFNGKIERIYNHCVPYRNGRLFSSSFEVFVEENQFFGVINLFEGILKVYKSLHSDNQYSPPFYSGKGKYMVINNVRIVKPAHYDYKMYKHVSSVFGGFLEVYSFFDNELVYKIDKRQLHSNTLLGIDKIEYEIDGFRITLGNYLDSDEFVDFNLIMDEGKFLYEINDKTDYCMNEML